MIFVAFFWLSLVIAFVWIVAIGLIALLEGSDRRAAASLRNPFKVENRSARKPRVATGAQSWAECVR